MIYCLKGIVTSFTNNSVILMINNASMAFEVFVPKPSIVSKNTEILFYTYMHWNQENGPSLYGFLSEAEKNIFQLVISCSGIGPKIGLAVLGQIEPKQFIKIINDADTKALSSVNGIGTKKAEQIIVHLKHKIAAFIESGFIEDSLDYKNVKEISEVLNSLNYSKNEINGALEHIKNNCLDKEYSFDQMLRQALTHLSKRV